MIYWPIFAPEITPAVAFWSELIFVLLKIVYIHILVRIAIVFICASFFIDNLHVKTNQNVLTAQWLDVLYSFSKNHFLNLNMLFFGEYGFHMVKVDDGFNMDSFFMERGKALRLYRNLFLFERKNFTIEFERFMKFQTRSARQFLESFFQR